MVSRSKPFQEGEYDVDIKSTSTRNHEEESVRLRRRQRSSAAAEDQSRHHHLGNNSCRDQMLITAISARRRRRSSAAAEDPSRPHHLGTNSCRDRMKTTALSAASSRHLSLPRPNGVHGFNQLQTRLWRPGEYLLQSEASHISPSCILSHWIRRIQPWSFKLQHFPYPAPRAFTLGAINVQRLYCLYCCVLEPHSLNLDVPRHHSFAPKLSRLKARRHLPYLAEILHLSLQRLVP